MNKYLKYKNKYLKYKNKYNNINNLEGGSKIPTRSSSPSNIPRFFRSISPTDRIINKRHSIKQVPSDQQKWLVLDVDECLYPPTYTDESGTFKFVDSFINIHKEFTEKYLNTINAILTK